MNPQDTKYHEGLLSQGFPSCAFVAFVVKGLAS